MKREKGRFRLTRKGGRLAENKFTIVEFAELFEFYMRRADLGYEDGMDDMFDAQGCLPFLLYILREKADRFVSAKTIADLFLEAFPNLKLPSDGFISSEEMFMFLCETRFLRRFFSFFGLVDVKIPPIGARRPLECRKTELFDELFVWNV